MSARFLQLLSYAPLAAPVIVLALLAWHRRWVTDDAFIDLRVVRNLLEGHGPVFNLGERVGAYSNPLWAALLALAGLLFRSLAGGPPLEWLAVWLGLILTLTGLLTAQFVALILARQLGATHVPGAVQQPTSDSARGTSHAPTIASLPAGVLPIDVHSLTHETPVRRAPFIALPLGVLVLVPLSAQWDFTTSGLETGLTFAWLGLTFLAIAARPASLATATLAGLGPLVRPDLLIFSLGFLLALIPRSHSVRPLRPARLVTVLAAFLLLPLTYQLFRMGYFASLLPNTGLAKEAGLPRWDQGWLYLRDFVDTYRLWLPLAAAGATWLVLLVRLAHHRRWIDLPLALIPVTCGLLYVTAVGRVGGDFMHGRILLPPLFAILLPVAAVGISSLRYEQPSTRAANNRAPATRERRALGGRAEGAQGVRGQGWQGLLPVLPLVIILPWAIVAAQHYRPPYFAKGNGVGSHGIADERTFYVQLAGHHPNPVTLADYAPGVWPRDGHALRALAERPDNRVLLPTTDWLVERGPHGPPPESPLAPTNPSWLDPRIRVVAHRNNVGLTGYAAGPTVHLVDHLGLADPLASRLRLEVRKRPGHEKELPDAWVLARFGLIGLASQTSAPLDAAHQTLTCPGSPLAELLDAITQPLTWPRFWQNVALSSRLTALRFSADPLIAHTELCR